MSSIEIGVPVRVLAPGFAHLSSSLVLITGDAEGDGRVGVSWERAMTRYDDDLLHGVRLLPHELEVLGPRLDVLLGWLLRSSLVRRRWAEYRQPATATVDDREALATDLRLRDHAAELERRWRVISDDERVTLIGMCCRWCGTLQIPCCCARDD